MSRYAMVTLLVALLLSLSGCAKAAEMALEKATGIQVDQSGESVTITGKDGESFNINAEMPEQFKDFPVPSGFKYDSGSTMESGEDYFSVATWTGKGDVEEVGEFYQTRLPDQGWEEVSTISGDGNMMLSFENGEDSVTITIDGSDEITISAMTGKSSEQSEESSSEASTDSEETAVEEEETVDESDTSDDGYTPEPPETTDVSALPEVLKQVPAPDGFAVVVDSTLELTEGGELQMAAAQWYGEGEPKDAGEFYRESLPSLGWEENQYMTIEGQVMGVYTNAEEGLSLYVTVTAEDEGTYIYVQMGPAE